MDSSGGKPGMNLSHQSFVAALAVATMTVLLVATSVGYAQQGEDLREAAQNPIADLISVPFQNNSNFDIGRTDNTQNVLNIQPVYWAPADQRQHRRLLQCGNARRHWR